ncbi:MAG: HAD family hydrolase [Candidatus Bathyarchaeota archaeon]|nr:HAD family hydrolase [Candidatus Bathyarchaeota archaeon]
MIKAALFDLHGTLAYVENPITDSAISERLFSRGYEVSPQQFRAAMSLVSFIDYPKYGYQSWRSYLSRVFWRLNVKVDEETLHELVNLLNSKPYQLYSDSADAVKKAKENSFKTAIVTTITYFKFEKAIRPIRSYLDVVMTGYEARCDKSSPKMYKKVLDILKVKPQEAVMIGDDEQLDFVLPKSLGMNALLLKREREGKGKVVDAFVYNLKEAMETIIRQCYQS